MSLSQKHSGLILVPWFNSDEWRYVYHSVYSKDREKQLKALELLKIWKMRTPILSTGVEGTFILLDVLLLDSNALSNEQLSNLYAIALMRFLNLSAANSDKQGAFTKTSAKNDLPKWIVNLRHDIAHGHQIPSLYNLKMGLDFGFDWLKEKYWEPQSKIIKDYYIGEESDTENHLLNSLKAYIEVNLALFENRELASEYVETIKDTIYRKFKKSIAHPCFMVDILLEMVSQSLEKDYQNDTVVQLCLEKLVSPKALLKPNFEVLMEEEGNEKLDKNFRNIWQSLLNILHHYGLLLFLVEKLFDVVGDISYSNNTKKMAAMWINELFTALRSLRDSKQTEDDPIKLEINQYIYTEESLNFQKQTLNCSNKFLDYFLNSVLKYNSDDINFNNDVLNLVKAESEVENLYLGVGERIYTLEDLKVENLTLEDLTSKEIQSSSTNIIPVVAESKWKKIEDTSMFKNCPLGVLPHQLGQRHPFLVLG